MRSDLTCPIEVVDVRVEQQETEGAQAVVCVIRFLNLMEKAVDSVQMNIICFDEAGTRLGGRLVRAFVHDEDDIRHFAGAFMPEHVDGVARVEASVEKVWFKDSEVWRREERNVREYTPNNLPEGRELDRLRTVAGPDAAGYPYEGDLFWMCVCGRANTLDDKLCFKCHRERARVLAEYSYAAIESTVGRRERDLEKRTRENLRKSSEQTVKHMTAEQEKRRQRSRRMGTVIALLILAVAGLSAWRWGVPCAASVVATKRLDSGLSADAKAIFEWIDLHWPGQFGAKENAQEAERRIIEGLIAVGHEDALVEASWRARAIPGPEGGALYERAQLALAASCEVRGDYERAQAIYEALRESDEAAKRLLELIYTVADAAQERVDYPTAIERFASLGDYRDAQERHTQCIYLYGRQLLREGHYKQAAEQFMLVSGEEDALELARQSYYLLAQVHQQDGEYVAAAELYESLGVYEQAHLRARECRYAAGMQALKASGFYADMDDAAQGDEAEAAEPDGEAQAYDADAVQPVETDIKALGDAAEQFALAGDYEDAQARFEAAVYMLSEHALESGDAQTAVGWLQRLPRGEEATAALNAATYALAEEREAGGDREGAVLAYASLGNYKDAVERMRALEYALALDEIAISPESALARFEALGDYADAAEQALRCRYVIADAAYADGEYEQAIDLFDALGDYQDSAGKLRRSRYALAGTLREAGKYENAAALYEACGAYLDAEELALRSRYDGAEALEEEGDLAAAARAFDALGSYEDAPERARGAENQWLGALYADATMNMELGDYDSVIKGLGEIWQQELPERYAGMAQLYIKACLARADELIAQNRPLEALPILESIADEPEAQEKLSANVYLVVGTWETVAGARYVFRRDGSCSLDGREAYFGGKDYDILIGDEPRPTQAGYRFVRMSGGVLTLRDAQTDALLRLKYVGEPLDLIDEESAQAEPADEAEGQPDTADGSEAGDAQAEPNTGGSDQSEVNENEGADEA